MSVCTFFTFVRAFVRFLHLYERLYVFANIGFPSCFLIQNPKSSPQLDCIIIQSEVHHLLKKSLR